MSQTPVAWKYVNMRTGSGSFGTKYPDLTHPEDFVITELFTGNQLRQARADALRDAAEWFNTEAGIIKDSGKVTVAAFQLNRMAAELEKEK